MQYKTIMLSLLEQDRPLHDRLRRSQQLLPTLDRLATELRGAHLAWQAELARGRPQADTSRLASEAMELAIYAMQERLSCEHGPSEPTDDS